MVRCWVMFGVIVTHVFESGVSIDVELLASNLIGNPKIGHFHGGGALVLDGVVGNSGSGGVIAIDGSQQLWVAKVLESEVDDTAFLGIAKQCSEFCFGHRCCDIFEDCGDDIDGTIEFDCKVVMWDPAKNLLIMTVNPQVASHQ